MSLTSSCCLWLVLLSVLLWMCVALHRMPRTPAPATGGASRPAPPPVSLSTICDMLRWRGEVSRLDGLLQACQGQGQ